MPRREFRLDIRLSPRTAATALLLGLGIGGSGCGSGTDAGVAGDGRPSTEEVDAFHETLCKSALSCCVTLGKTQGILEECKLNLRTRARGYDREAGAACLLELARAEQAGQCWAVGLGPSDPCRHFWSGRYGTNRAGEPCTDDSDCVLPPAGTSTCSSKDTCQWLVPGAPGDAPCMADVSTELDFTLFYGDGSIPNAFYCSDADGVHCDVSSSTCRARSPVGADCSANKDCVSSYCAGSCEALIEVGGSCRGARCDDGGYCDDSQVTCGPTECERGPYLCKAKKPPGAACSSSDECTTEVCIGDVCSAMTRPARLALELVCLAGGVI